MGMRGMIRKKINFMKNDYELISISGLSRQRETNVQKWEHFIICLRNPLHFVTLMSFVRLRSSYLTLAKFLTKSLYIRITWGRFLKHRSLSATLKSYFRISRVSLKYTFLKALQAHLMYKIIKNCSTRVVFSDISWKSSLGVVPWMTKWNIHISLIQ